MVGDQTPRVIFPSSPYKRASASCTDTRTEALEGTEDDRKPGKQANESTCVSQLTIGSPPRLAPIPPVATLYSELCRLFDSVRRTGVTINRFQSIDSFSVLDAGVRTLVGQYIAAEHQDWRNFVEFNRLHYVRHLIDGNDDFELLLLCWTPGQESRAHNHADSHCWLHVMDGTVDEIRYETDVINDTQALEEQEIRDDEEYSDASAFTPASFPKNLPNVLNAIRPCPKLEIIEETRAYRGSEAMYINDSQALHVVRCPAECPRPGAVTLHLYSPPITRVTLYDPMENKVVIRTPGYYTIRGKKV
jgi:cysteine dioxygenase